MVRSTVCYFAVASAVAFGGCGLKPAGSSSTTASGGNGGGAGGMGGGLGGTGGSMPPPMLPPILPFDGGGDGLSTSTPDANCGAKSKTAMKVGPDILILLDSIQLDER